MNRIKRSGVLNPQMEQLTRLHGVALEAVLQGDIAAQPGVLRLVDHSHATLGDLLENFVVGECLAIQVSCRQAPGVGVTRTN